MVEISLTKLKEIYYTLSSCYDVYKMEAGEETRYEMLIKELKNMLMTDKQFIEENSLFAIASSGLGGNIIKAFKNKQKIAIDALKTVYFPTNEGGFHTRDIGISNWSKDEDKYVIFHGKSIEDAIKNLKELIELAKERIEKWRAFRGSERSIALEREDIERYQNYIEALEK